MIKGESYMVFGFPYQLPVAEGYYPEEQIREEMQEDDFDSIAWSINFLYSLNLFNLYQGCAIYV